MGKTWFPDGWVLDVPNPGYGELLVEASRYPNHGKPLVEEDWAATLNGPELGVFLTAVTERALGLDPAPSLDCGMLPSWVTPIVARDLLPALQQAILLAVAGTERFDWTVRDDEQPPKPYCVICGEGTFYSRGALPSQWCDKHGHTAFGMGSETRWGTAQAIHLAQVARWKARQARRAMDTTT